MVGFRKSKKVGPFRFTLSKRGISTSAGAGPLRVTRGADGKYRRTVRLTGTGLYDTKVIGGGQQQQRSGAPTGAPGAGWYPDPTGGPGRKYWDGMAWHDAVPVRPGVPTVGKPPRKISTKALLIAAAVFIAVVVVGNILETRHEENKSASRTTTTAASTKASPMAPAPIPAATCSDAPAGIVAMIDAAFTNGEHLENAQAIELPKAMTIVGGNIVNPDGTRVSSQDSWLFSGGVAYALTSDARRHTILPDGRDLLYFDWTTYNDQVGTCVGRATKAANE